MAGPVEQTTVKTWQEKQAAKPNPYEVALSAWHETSGAEIVRMEEAIDAYEEALRAYRECDEPGCSKDGGCGWPTGDGGFRWTCWEHAVGMHK